ncbi:MAG: TonB-dependent receptor [Bacteroidia bacterium]
MKLKASYGVTGNAAINWGDAVPIYNFGFTGAGNNYNGQPIRYLSSLGNPDLIWERNYTLDAGVEFGLLNDRITTDLTYFRRITKGAVINTALQASSGIDNLVYIQNIGEILNKGVEFGLVTRNTVGAIKWTTRLNLTHIKNRVLEVGTATPDALAGGFGDTRAIPGEPVNTNYIVRFSHVDPATGAPVYLTGTGEETFTYSVANNRFAAGNGMPDLTGGITNEFAWKNFDLNFLVYFSLGGKIYDDAAKRHMGVVTDDWNMRRDYLDRWTQPGDNARYPRATMTMLNWGGNANFWQNNHTLWLEDASFARLRTVNIGYNIKPAQGQIRNIRLSLQGTNLLTFTNYTGVDPEVARERGNSQERNIGGTNITFLTPPNERTVTFGVNVDF